jgi:hypothetical protein
MKKVLFVLTIIAAFGFSVISCNSKSKKETEEKETVLEVQKINVNKVAGMESFATIEEAKTRAKKMGCEGYHEIKDGENVRYMPCKVHSDIKSQIEGDESKAKSHLKEGGDDVKKEFKKVDDGVKKEYEEVKSDLEKKKN